MNFLCDLENLVFMRVSEAWRFHGSNGPCKKCTILGDFPQFCANANHDRKTANPI